MKSLVINPREEIYWSLWQSKFIGHLMHKPRFIFLVASRQSGKTELCSRLIVHLAMNHPRRYPKMLISYNTMDQALKYVVNRFIEQLGSLPKEIFKIENTVSGAGKRIILNRTWLPYRSTVMIDFTGMGNAPAIRGGSYDFYFGDEGSQYPTGVFFNIIKPMMSATMGTYIITGTVDQINQFYELGMLHAKEQARGNRKYLFYFEDVLTASVFNREMIEDEYKAYEAIDDIEGFKNEYFNDVSAGASKLNPFIGRLAEVERDSNPDQIDKRQINISLDLGMRQGNSPYVAWCYRHIDKKPIVFDYCRTSIPDLLSIPRIMNRRYNQFQKIHIVFPADLDQPVLVSGYTQRDVLMSEIRRLGLGKKIAISVLPKTEAGGKAGLIRLTAEGMRRFVFADNVSSVQLLMRDLGKISFQKDPKTEYVDFAKPVKNKYIHVLDMLCYMHLAQKLASCRASTPIDLNLKSNYNSKKIEIFSEVL